MTALQLYSFITVMGLKVFSRIFPLICKPRKHEQRVQTSQKNRAISVNFLLTFTQEGWWRV